MLHERGPLADTHLARKLKVWQRRLKLEDWKVRVELAGPNRLRGGTLGNIRWDGDRKTAVIRVLDAAHYRKPFQETLRDMEFTLVHELIHLELSALPRSDDSRADEEDAVNRMTEALLELERGAQSESSK